MEATAAEGTELLKAMASGRAVRRREGSWRAGALRPSAGAVGALISAGLVREEAGSLLLTPAGRVRAGADRIGRPRRLLAERALPDHDAPPGKPRRSATVNLLESPLGWLKARGLIDQRQFDAGERLRADWTMAGLGPRVTMRWDAAPIASGARGADAPLDPTLAGIAAKRRFDGAIEAVGKGLADILWRVVCAGEGLELAEGALGWPKRSGKLVLIMALDRVGDYYGIR